MKTARTEATTADPRWREAKVTARRREVYAASATRRRPLFMGDSGTMLPGSADALKNAGRGREGMIFLCYVVKQYECKNGGGESFFKQSPLSKHNLPGDPD
ncbi:hypothetical protein THAOC_36877 [Thalassiosira oceanica]|uniref:Uncharacterized protein n=1 Tax=Thalassiosira oceanica TaxID=159749 RepID=K0QYY2_THAOC|nr:hypothetical protein THAOC_36877 [Thalassiosira oceanica]|eukprot:EJK44573.1 hypothetical protein THAOC_36877 [Thalassiosira oceanica]